MLLCAQWHTPKSASIRLTSMTQGSFSRVIKSLTFEWVFLLNMDTLTHIQHTSTIAVKAGSCWITDQTHIICIQSQSTFPWYHAGRIPVQYDYVGWSLFGSKAKFLCPTLNLKYDWDVVCMTHQIKCSESWLMVNERSERKDFDLFVLFLCHCSFMQPHIVNTRVN